MKSAAWTVAIAVVAALGCGATEGAGDPRGIGGASGQAGAAGTSGAAALPIEQFESSYISAICDHIGPCCARGGYSFDALACRSVYEQYVQSITAGAVADPPSSAYDSEAAAACVVLTAARGDRCVVEPLPEPNPCEQMFVGLLATGEPCTVSTDCAPVEGSTVTCATLGSDLTARCTAELDLGAYRRGALGEPCSATCTSSEPFLTQCRSASGGARTACHTNDALYCDSNGACAALPGIGAPCGSRSYCAEDAFCDSGTCAARRETGPCPTEDACATPAYCDDSGQCVAKAADGEPCTEAEACVSKGCSDGACGPPILASAENCTFSN